MMRFGKRNLREKAAIAAMHAIIGKTPFGTNGNTGSDGIFAAVARGAVEYADQLVDALDAKRPIAYTVTFEAPSDGGYGELVAELHDLIGEGKSAYSTAYNSGVRQCIEIVERHLKGGAK